MVAHERWFEYVVVTGGNPGELEKAVNANLRIGYVLVGGLCLLRDAVSDTVIWGQAMARKDRLV